jgi:hypothetical protein
MSTKFNCEKGREKKLPSLKAETPALGNDVN